MIIAVASRMHKLRFDQKAERCRHFNFFTFARTSVHYSLPFSLSFSLRLLRLLSTIKLASVFSIAGPFVNRPDFYCSLDFLAGMS